LEKVNRQSAEGAAPWRSSIVLGIEPREIATKSNRSTHSLDRVQARRTATSPDSAGSRGRAPSALPRWVRGPEVPGDACMAWRTPAIRSPRSARA